MHCILAFHVFLYLNIFCFGKAIETSVSWASQATSGGDSTLSRSNHNAVVHGKDMIVFGGVSSGSVKHNDLWKLDLESKVWTSLTPAGTAPAARIGASAVNYALGLA